MKSLRIVLTGGGSGGHVTPLLAVAEELERLAVEDKLFLEIVYCGPRDAYTEMFAAKRIRTVRVLGGKLRRYFSLWTLLDLPKIAVGFLYALFRLYVLMPDVVFSKGGTGALPVVFAAWFYRIPVIIHESDAVPGLTNLLSARFAKRVAVSFEAAEKFFNPAVTAVVGTPVRAELLRGPTAEETAKEHLGFLPGEPLTLIYGGSQGAARLNNLVAASLPNLLKLTAVLHQTGRANFAEVQSLTRAALLGMSVEVERRHPYKAVGYFDAADVKAAFSAADVVVSRAGSTNIHEIAAFGKPSVIVPIEESANGHQRANAYEYAKTSAAVVIEEENLLEKIFLNELGGILQNAEKRAAMKKAALAFYKPDAARLIAEEILKLGFRI